MKTEEQVREAYNKFLEENPKEWVYTQAGDLIQAWYQGYEQAMKFVLEEE